MTRPDALNILRDATNDLHTKLESQRIINRNDAGREEYASWAKAMYGWLSSFEAGLWSAHWPVAMNAPARAGKRQWLAADLKALGETDEVLAALPAADTHLHVHLQTEAKRFGVAYVLELGTLGGQVLLRTLASKIAPSPGRYLEGYGPNTDLMWSSFSEALGQSLTSPSALEHAAESARSTLVSLAGWFNARGVG